MPKSKKPAFFDYLRDLGRNRLFPARSAGADFGENFRRLDRQIARIVTFHGLDEAVFKQMRVEVRQVWRNLEILGGHKIAAEVARLTADKERT